MGVKINGKFYVIPKRMVDALERYVNQGVPTGHFLEAVIKNNFFEAVGRADDVSLTLFPAYANLLRFEAPAMCVGSEEKYDNWIECGGLRGIGFKDVSYVHFSDPEEKK